MPGRHHLGLAAAPDRGRGREVQRATGKVTGCQGALFATQAECPHKGGPLADGLIGDTTLICPLHDWFFDLATGRLKNGECEIATYPVRASDDGQILVTLQSG